MGAVAAGADSGAADFSAVGLELHPKEKSARAARANAPEKDNLNDCMVRRMFCVKRLNVP